GKNNMDNIKQLVADNVRKFGMIIALAGIAILFQILTGGKLLTPLNITNIIMQNSDIIILAIGMMIVIITGEIDLSVGSFAALIGAIAGVLLVTHDMPVYLTIIICIVLGALFASYQYVWIVYFNLLFFII